MTLTPEQIEVRKTGIGGSEAAAACGISPWKTPLTLYLEKREEIPPFEGNEATRWGHLLEPVVRQEYANRTGRIVRMPSDTFRHPEHSFMLCHPDGVTDCRRLYEGKTARYDYDWGPDGSDRVPEDYMLQVQHNMLVMGLEVADIAVLIGGSDFRCYEIPADRELQEMLVEAEAELWDRIVRGDPPPAKNEADLRRMFPHSRAGSVEADDEILEAVSRLKALKAEEKALKEQISETESAIKLHLGEYDTLTQAGKVLATWKSAKPRQALDTDGLRNAHPDIYAQFLKTGDPVRRFLLK